MTLPRQEVEELIKNKTYAKLLANEQLQAEQAAGWLTIRERLNLPRCQGRENPKEDVCGHACVRAFVSIIYR